MAIPPSGMFRKFYQALNLAPRSLRRGKHRRAGSQNHSNPTNGAGAPQPGAGSGLGAFFAIDNPADPSAEPLTIVTTVNFAHFTFSLPDIPGPPEIPNAGIRAGELTGYRAWWCVDGQRLSEPRLFSLANDEYEWLPGKIARGNVNEQIGPVDFGRQRMAGIYSFKEMSSVLEEAHILARDYNRGRAVAVGTIKMWGQVVEHEIGWRAEFAKITSIDRVIVCAGMEHRFYLLHEVRKRLCEHFDVPSGW